VTGNIVQRPDPALVARLVEELERLPGPPPLAFPADPLLEPDPAARPLWGAWRKSTKDRAATSLFFRRDGTYDLRLEAAYHRRPLRYRVAGTWLMRERGIPARNDVEIHISSLHATDSALAIGVYIPLGEHRGHVGTWTRVTEQIVLDSRGQILRRSTSRHALSFRPDGSVLEVRLRSSDRGPPAVSQGITRLLPGGGIGVHDPGGDCFGLPIYRIVDGRLAPERQLWVRDRSLAHGAAARSRRGHRLAQDAQRLGDLRPLAGREAAKSGGDHLPGLLAQPRGLGVSLVGQSDLDLPPILSFVAGPADPAPLGESVEQARGRRDGEARVPREIGYRAAPLEQPLHHHTLGDGDVAAADGALLESVEEAAQRNELAGDLVHGFRAWIA
jgi:hypothetical protein